MTRKKLGKLNWVAITDTQYVVHAYSGNVTFRAIVYAEAVKGNSHAMNSWKWMVVRSDNPNWYAGGWQMTRDRCMTEADKKLRELGVK